MYEWNVSWAILVQSFLGNTHALRMLKLSSWKTNITPQIKFLCNSYLLRILLLKFKLEQNSFERTSTFHPTRLGKANSIIYRIAILYFLVVNKNQKIFYILRKECWLGCFRKSTFKTLTKFANNACIILQVIIDFNICLCSNCRTPSSRSRFGIVSVR